MPRMRLLVVEDDRILGDGIRAGLAQAGFAVDWVEDGRAAELALAAEPYDLVVLDLGLPRRSGLEVLAGLRARGNAIPVLILTARDTVGDRVGGLDAGADDYLVKPFDLAELTARVRALVRRSAGGADPVLRVGDVALDPRSRRVTRAGAPIELSPREFAVLHELMRHAGRVLSRERLERSLYEWNEEPGSNAIEVYVHHLRRKLGADVIRTQRGAGYLIERAPAEARS
jgi:two-component system, OmpR family, response regulator QseB